MLQDLQNNRGIHLVDVGEFEPEYVAKIVSSGPCHSLSHSLRSTGNGNENYLRLSIRHTLLSCSVASSSAVII